MGHASHAGLFFGIFSLFSFWEVATGLLEKRLKTSLRSCLATSLAGPVARASLEFGTE